MFACLRISLFCATIGLSALAAQQYSLGPDSQVREGVPKGRLEHFEYTSAKIYPGTVRDVWIYVPAQYDAAKPAAVMIFQDGRGFINTQGDSAWMAPVVLDNLIDQGAMPVTIGVFIQPGVLPEKAESKRGRYNRSYEYDAVGDRYARFLIEEILPEVANKYNLTDDPNLRGIGGSSSGGIAAFTAAWERPDVFRRVLSFVGSFVNLRGGQSYPGLVRKTAPKPLRIYQQDGQNDLDIYSGSWYRANVELASALDYAGYDHKFIVGYEGHNNRHGRMLLPDALRWLWRDWTKPVEANRYPLGERHWVLEFMDPLQPDWEVISSGHTFTEGPAMAPNGDVYFSDVRESKIFKIDAKTDKVSLFQQNTGQANGLMFGPDGRLYSCRRDAKAIVATDVSTGKDEIIVHDVEPNDLVVTVKGDIYFTDPWNKKVGYVGKDRKLKMLLDETSGIERPNGIMVSPDQSLLTVADTYGKWVWSFEIQPDGSIANGQPFYGLETTDVNDHSGADGMTMLASGHLIVATALGLQICDQPGRVVGIIPADQPGWLSNATFAGPDMQTLYITAQDKVLRRHMRVKGVKPWEVTTPPVPRL